MGIRLSSNQFVYNYKISLNEAYGKQQKLMEQGDGSKIHRPSDNAVDYTKLLRYNISDNENNQYQTNVQTALSWMQMADATAVQMTEIQKTFKEKTTAAANDTNNETDMAAIGKEMLAEIQELVSLGNTQQVDRYIFSGQADLIQPFRLQPDLRERGLAKTLDDKQREFFSNVDASGDVRQMLTLEHTDDEGKTSTYYLDTLNGYLYTQDFVENGYKDRIASGQTTVVPAEDAVDKLTVYSEDETNGFRVSTYFNKYGEILDASKTVTVGDMELSFKTIAQQVVHYTGDDKYISMVKLNGEVDPSSDTVNMTGQDLFGADIFDDPNSGNRCSGTAMLNNMLTVCQQTLADNQAWLSSDGMTLSDAAHAVTVKAETKMGARAQLYESVANVLTKQGELITGDITQVSSTDVAELAMNLMEQQTLYNLALSLGARVIPQSLADYL